MGKTLQQQHSAHKPSAPGTHPLPSPHCSQEGHHTCTYGGTYLTSICTCTHVHTMEDVFSYFGMRMHTHTHTCKHKCMHVHMHTLAHIYACTQTHTHTHTHPCTHMYLHKEIFHGVSSAQQHDVEELTARAVFSSCLGHVITVAQ